MLVFAYDRRADTGRWRDLDGRLHVPESVISRAEVNEYAGQEIPRREALGLDAKSMYRMLRHPDELSAAADSFHGVPILSKHVPVSAMAHRPDLVVGVVLNPAWRDPDLVAELVFWSGEAISRIEANGDQGLSSAYRYTADMTPGRFGGQRYQGVMRNLEANHVALVETPRVSSAIVGDAAFVPRRRCVDRAAHWGSFWF
jgi:uncharacterized protein